MGCENTRSDSDVPGLEIYPADVAVFTRRQLRSLSGYTGNVWIWNAKTGIVKNKLDDCNAKLNSLAVSHQSKLLAGAGADHAVWVWDVSNPSLLELVRLNPF